MSKINPKNFSVTIKPKRGEIYWVELDPTKGSEIKKTRPCLIISNDVQNEVSRRVMVIPLTSSQKLPLVSFHVDLVFQDKPAKILPEQMRVANKSRIKKYCGKVGWEILDQVEVALHITLGLKN